MGMAENRGPRQIDQIQFQKIKNNPNQIFGPTAVAANLALTSHKKL